MDRSVSKSHLAAIKKLVDDLSDRDLKIKRDIRLFEEFFNNFPVGVSIWTLSSEGAVVSQRGNGLICEGAKCIDTLFHQFEEKNVCIDAHKKALTGTPFQRVMAINEKSYFVSVAPRRDEEGNVSGVIGLAWDVSSNHEMLSGLQEIIDLADKPLKENSLTDIKNIAKKALEKSVLYKLTNSGD